MKSKHLVLFLITVLFALPTSRAFAGSATSFEVVATFDYPGFRNTIAFKINDAGYVAGPLKDGKGVYGYTRSPDGHFSKLINVPDGAAKSSSVYGINNQRHICGAFSGGPRSVEGFLRVGHRFITVYLPGSSYTDVLDLNDAGNFCGDHSQGGNYAGYVNIDKHFFSFSIPDAIYVGAFGMNNLNQCVGYYYIGTDFQSFLRAADGTLTYPITKPDGEAIALYEINDLGWMAGASFTSTSHGIIFFSPTEFAEYDYPGARATAFYGISNTGLVCGKYEDDQGEHGLIVRVSR